MSQRGYPADRRRALRNLLQLVQTSGGLDHRLALGELLKRDQEAIRRRLQRLEQELAELQDAAGELLELQARLEQHPEQQHLRLVRDVPRA